MKLRPELLLHPNIPKPLHGISPREILGKEWWDIQRQKAYKLLDYHCHACGIHKSKAKYHKWLEGHEFYNINYSTGKMKLLEIVALCHSCHNYIHDGRLRMLLRDDKISQEKYDDIINHGDTIIRTLDYDAVDLDYLQEYETGNAKWNDWHLDIDGKLYYSKFKNYNDWKTFYENKK